MITIYDIAEKTGYSPATISKVLNNYKGVSKKAQEEVSLAIKELGYIPNGNARGLMLKRSFIIAVVLQDDGKGGLLHSHFSEIVESFRKYVSNHGYDIILLGNNIGSKRLSLKDHCQYRSVDGVLIAVGEDNSFNTELKELLATNIPIISVESKYPNKNVVISENIKSTTKLLEYAYFNGHRDFGIAYVKGNFYSSQQRYSAFIDFCKYKNLNIFDDFIKPVHHFDYESGKICALEFVKNKQLPSVIFCVCDEIALGMIDTFRVNGIQVPNDVSIIGFDDLTRAKLEGLTTIRQDRSRIGTLAGEKLLNIIENNDCFIDELEISTELVIRSSCKDIN